MVAEGSHRPSRELEGYALEAIDAWERDRGPAIDKQLWSSSTSSVNAAAVERSRKLSSEEVIRRADATHAELLTRIGDMTDARWRRPGTRRGRRSVAERLGASSADPRARSAMPTST